MNTFAGLPYATRSKTRKAIQRLLSTANSDSKKLCEEALLPSSQVQIHLPVQIGGKIFTPFTCAVKVNKDIIDYTDYSCAYNHIIGAPRALYGQAAAKVGQYL